MNKPLRNLARRLAAALLLAVLGLLVVPILCCVVLDGRIDALQTAILDRLGTAVRPDAPFPGYRPPVDPADDPIAALDSDELESDRNSFAALRPVFFPRIVHKASSRSGRPSPSPRLHPLSDDEAALLSDWFASHSVLPAAAEAFTVPGYRSSLSGFVKPADLARDDFSWLEPRAVLGLPYASLLSFRARLAFRNGDAPAALADLLRIYDGDAATREPTLIGGSCARAFASIALSPDLRLDLCSDDALEALPRAAETFADRLEARWPDLLAGEMMWFRVMLLHHPTARTWFPDWYFGFGGEANRRPPLLLRPWLACWLRIGFLELLRYDGDLADGLAAIAAMPCGPARAAAARDLRESMENRLDDPKKRCRSCFYTLLAPSAEAFLRLLNDPRADAALLRTATAVERFRRARGTLPPDLPALVPDFLPALPLDPATGEPFPYTPGPVSIPEETFPAFPSPGAAPDALRTLPPATLPGYLLGPRFFPLPAP